MTRRTVALALGSGGARGYTHIGVLHELAARDCEVVSIAGSSMGALIGGLHAAGKLDGYEEWVRTLTRFDVVRLLDAKLTQPGLIKAERIFSHVRDLVGDTRIEDLPIPYTAVATDLAARKAVWFQRGALLAAMRASISIPGVFTPVVLNGRVLVDGGVMEPVPIAPTAAVRADLTIAVDLGGKRSAAPASDTADDEPREEWLDRFKQGAAHIFERDVLRSFWRRDPAEDTDLGDDHDVEAAADATSYERAAGEEIATDEPAPAGLGRFDVMNQSLEAMQSVLTRYRLASYPADILITVPKDACASIEFHRANEMIDLGRSLAAAALDAEAIG